jgi:membrane associated rhomboid family serine protease
MSSIIDDIKLQYRIGGIVNKVIYWNVAAFVVSLPLFFQFKLGKFEYPLWFELSSNPKDVLFFPWTLITYSFLHSGFWHLFFNMIMLNFAGRLFLTFFTQKQFLGLYILSSIFGGLVFVISYYLLQYNAPIVGASGAVLSLLVATTAYQPLMNIRLIFLGNVKLWHLTAVILILDIMQIMLENTGGHIVHISGAVFGILYIQLLKKGTDLSLMVTNCINFFATLFQPKNSVPFKKVHVNPKKPFVKKESKIVTKDKTQQQIDEILDKISKSGYDSLTKDEKQFLFNSGK